MCVLCGKGKAPDDGIDISLCVPLHHFINYEATRPEYSTAYVSCASVIVVFVVHHMAGL